MYISNTKVLAIPYFIIIFVLLFAGLFTYAATMMLDMMQQMQFEMPVKNAAPMLLQTTKISHPSVVELFTSEGCSSCPAADKLVASAQSELNEAAIVLSYHVDYWNKLGWKDPFSKSIFSDRQRQYAAHLKLESVYTPQAVVNGITEFVGSNKSALWNAIHSYKNVNTNSIEAATPVLHNQQLTVQYNYPSLSVNEHLVLELVLKNATTKVQRGENSGSTLSHINIVQDILQTNESKGTATFEVPVNFEKQNYMIVAFVQHNKTFEITSATIIKLL
jgi:hypothetical protein